MQNNNMKSPQSARLRTETATANYLISIRNSTLLLYVVLKLRCGAVGDGKHMQPFLKFSLKAEIHFLIEIFLGVAVLTA